MTLAPPKTDTPAPGRVRRAVGLLGQHKAFAVLAGVGLLLRVICIAAYHNAIMFYGDSWEYLRFAQQLHPDATRPYGYSAFLRLLSWTHSLVVVVVVQHALGLFLGWLVYRFLISRGIRKGVAAIAAAPVLLDAYQIGIEQYLMSEVLFETLLVGALLVCVRQRLSVAAAAGAGLLVSATMVTRTIGIPVAVICAAYLLTRRIPLVRLAAFVMPVVVVYAGYGLWYHHYHGGFGLQGAGGRMEYGRVAPFAKCKGLQLQPDEHLLCKKMRHGTPTSYTWGHSPYHQLVKQTTEAHAEQVASKFARTIILHQPTTYARVVALDTLHFFEPIRHTSGWDFPLTAWRLPLTPMQEAPHTVVSAINFNGHYARPGVVRPLARALRGYQRVGYTWGPLLALAIAASVVAAVRRRPLVGEADERFALAAPRLDVALLVSVAGMLLVVPNATVLFDYRYLIPTVPLLSLSAALAVARLAPTRILRPPDGAPPPAAPPPDAARPSLTPSLVGAGVLTLVALLLILAAPIRHNPFLSAYADSLGRPTTVGIPQGSPQRQPWPPHLLFQRFTRAMAVQRRDRKVVIIPNAIAVRLGPAEWRRLGQPVKCTGRLETPRCRFAHGIVNG